MHGRGNTTVSGGTATDLILIRHAPALTGGRLCGRTDVDAEASNLSRIAAVRALAGPPARLIVSPAQRCRQTAQALWPDLASTSVADLWEQDFGAWDGCPYAELPDLGRLPASDLASHRPPGGESFADLAARVWPALSQIADAGSATIVAHAGTIRAGLSLVMGNIPAGLAFDVAPLSVTRIARLPGGAGWVVRSVNGQAE